MIRPSFKQIRLALFFPPASGGTGAAGPCRLAFANDNARLRLCPDFPNRVLRLAGRFALAQLRSVVKPARAIPTAFRSHCRLVVQFGPRAVFELSAAYPSFVKARHHWPLRFEDHSNTDGWREADKCWSETDNAERC